MASLPAPASSGVSIDILKIDTEGPGLAWKLRSGGESVRWCLSTVLDSFVHGRRNDPILLPVCKTCKMLLLLCTAAALTCLQKHDLFRRLCWQSRLCKTLRNVYILYVLGSMFMLQGAQRLLHCRSVAL